MHWFTGSNLALVFAADLIWGRAVNMTAKATSVPMSTYNGWWGWSLWFPAILCAVNMAFIAAYWAYERAVPKAYRPVLGVDTPGKASWQKRKDAFKTVPRLPKFFWFFFFALFA